MDNKDDISSEVELEPLVRAAHVMYGSFFSGNSSLTLASLFLSQSKIKDAKGTWLESHFRWHTQTMWRAISGVLFSIFGWVLFGYLPFLPIISIGFWVLFRNSRGWSRLNDKKEMRSDFISISPTVFVVVLLFVFSSSFIWLSIQKALTERNKKELLKKESELSPVKEVYQTKNQSIAEERQDSPTITHKQSTKEAILSDSKEESKDSPETKKNSLDFLFSTLDLTSMDRRTMRGILKKNGFDVISEGNISKTDEYLSSKAFPGTNSIQLFYFSDREGVLFDTVMDQPLIGFRYSFKGDSIDAMKKLFSGVLKQMKVNYGNPLDSRRSFVSSSRYSWELKDGCLLNLSYSSFDSAVYLEYLLEGVKKRMEDKVVSKKIKSINRFLTNGMNNEI